MESHDVRLQNLIPFRPGEVTNPKGRGNSLNRSTVIKKWLDVQISIEDLEGGTFTGTAEDKIVLAMIRKAGAGDVAAAALLLDGRYGKQKTGIEVTASKSKPIDLSQFTEQELREIAGYNRRFLEIQQRHVGEVTDIEFQ